MFRGPSVLLLVALVAPACSAGTEELDSGDHAFTSAPGEADPRLLPSDRQQDLNYVQAAYRSAIGRDFEATSQGSPKVPPAVRERHQALASSHAPPRLYRWRARLGSTIEKTFWVIEIDIMPLEVKARELYFFTEAGEALARCQVPAPDSGLRACALTSE